MVYGTGPQAVEDILADNWQESRAGRPDVPPLVTDSNGNPSIDPDDIDAPGELMIIPDRERVETNRAVVDTIWVYTPEQDPGTWEDRGYSEEYVGESVQVDIDLTDRTNPATGERVSAKERMVGDRDDASFSGADPPYPGILGETKYVLETVRRGYEEYDVVRTRPLGGTLKNSDATYRLEVLLELLAKETVQ